MFDALMMSHYLTIIKEQRNKDVLADLLVQ